MEGLGGRPRRGRFGRTTNTGEPQALHTTHRQLTTVPAWLYIGGAPCVGSLFLVDIFSSNLLVVSEASLRDLHPVAAADIIRLTELEQV